MWHDYVHKVNWKYHLHKTKNRIFLDNITCAFLYRFSKINLLKIQVSHKEILDSTIVAYFCTRDYLISYTYYLYIVVPSLYHPELIWHFQWKNTNTRLQLRVYISDITFFSLMLQVRKKRDFSNDVTWVMGTVAIQQPRVWTAAGIVSAVAVKTRNVDKDPCRVARISGTERETGTTLTTGNSSSDDQSRAFASAPAARRRPRRPYLPRLAVRSYLQRSIGLDKWRVVDPESITTKRLAARRQVRTSRAMTMTTYNAKARNDGAHT